MELADKKRREYKKSVLSALSYRDLKIKGAIREGSRL